jgi:hypothetical protein
MLAYKAALAQLYSVSISGIVALHYSITFFFKMIQSRIIFLEAQDYNILVLLPDLAAQRGFWYTEAFQYDDEVPEFVERGIRRINRVWRYIEDRLKIISQERDVLNELLDLVIEKLQLDPIV